MSRLRMAVIGVGHLGKEHARILADMPDVELVGVVDANPDQAGAIARRYNTTAYADYWPLLNLVDAATVVVPTTYHHGIAREFLRRGIPLLVEKPLTATVAEADELVALRASRACRWRSGTSSASIPPSRNCNRGRCAPSSLPVNASAPTRPLDRHRCRPRFDDSRYRRGSRPGARGGDVRRARWACRSSASTRTSPMHGSPSRMGASRN